MKKGRRNTILTLLVLLVLAVLFNRTCSPAPSKECTFDDRIEPSALVYTHHAQCRMACRFIDQKLVEEVYQKGVVNCKKSGLNNGDMRYALEMKDRDGDTIRIIIEDENGKHIVITVIRIGFDDKCECS